MFYKNNKERIADDGFDRYVYSDVGRDVKVNANPDNEDEGYSAIDYGWMRKMVTHSVSVFKRNIPWEDTSIVDTTKNVLPIRGTTNKLVVKHATIDVFKLRAACSDNKSVGYCLDYLCRMLLHKDAKVSSFLYTLWNDAMKQERFCVEKYTYDENTSKVTTVTFRFIATKWNDSWEVNFNKNMNNAKTRKITTVTMGCDRPARVNISSNDEDVLTLAEQEIMDAVGPTIFGNEEIEVKHDMVVVTKDKSEEAETAAPAFTKKVIKKPVVIVDTDEDKASIADIVNCKLG